MPEMARSNVLRAGLSDRVMVRTGSAYIVLLDLIKSSEPPFDMIFIDADKPGYSRYLELSLQLSRSGTVILADNVIRNGLVLDESPTDENAKGARKFNRIVASHPRLESVIIPLFRQKLDGITLARVR